MFQNGPILCGGGDDETMKTCLTTSRGQWRASHNLNYNRSYHTSWDTPDGGVLLVGGENSPDTTELLNDEEERRKTTLR